jgi:hypothetical protein
MASNITKTHLDLWYGTSGSKATSGSAGYEAAGCVHHGRREKRVLLIGGDLGVLTRAF